MRLVNSEQLERHFHSLYVKMGFDSVEATEHARMAREYVTEYGAVTLMDNCNHTRTQYKQSVGCVCCRHCGAIRFYDARTGKSEWAPVPGWKPAQ